MTTFSEVNYTVKCPAANFIKLCAPDNTNDTLAEFCNKEPMGLVMNGNRYYKNIYCAQCNGESLGSLTCPNSPGT